jgi:hypothetical protein
MQVAGPSANRTFRMLAAAVALGCSAHAFAGPELLDVDTQKRAKIAKEKIRASAKQRDAEEREGQAADRGRCGSQDIGNIDTGGRIGTAPREVFVFAPNAINIVGRGSCR